MDFDVIVIGSGFGGSVVSCRLAEKGQRVCLLERGFEYPINSFPRRIHEVKEKFFWDPEDNHYGYMEIRENPNSDLMSVTSSGLGGGSLIYANVLLPMDEKDFKWWPRPYTRSLLDPYYQKVLAMMEASPYPFDKDPYYANTPKTFHYRNLASKLKKESDMLSDPELLTPPLAVNFRGSFPGEQTRNKHGAIQSKCTKCGECDIGCNIHAKNTLDLNYLFFAKKLEKTPLQTKTGAWVKAIKPINPNSEELGYIVEFVELKTKARKQISATKVIVSAGSIGSTELLLQQKKMGNLPHLSSALGTRWCGNGDMIGFGFLNKENLDPTNGPVITTAVKYQFKEYPDGFPSTLYLEDAGGPIGLAWYLAGKQPSPASFFNLIKMGIQFIKNKLIFFSSHTETNVGDKIAKVIDSDYNIRRLMVLLGMGKDRSDGKVELDKNGNAVIKWKINRSRAHFDRTRLQMKRVVGLLGGIYVDNPLTGIDKIVAVHPLGGCPMGEHIDEGVVNTKGEVFNYPNLFVVDGSIIPTSVGANPALTIAAVAEFIAESI